MHIKESMQNGGGLVPTQERARAYGARGAVPKLLWRTKLMAELQPNMTTEVSPPRFCMLSRYAERALARRRAALLPAARRHLLMP